MRRALPAIVLVVATGMGCVGPGFDYADLPEDPIWLVYRTREEAERVAELRQRNEEKSKRRRPNEAYVRLEEVGDLFGIGRTASQKQAAMMGRMARIDPRTQTIAVGDFANRGSRPLDFQDGRLLYLTLRRRNSHLFEYDSRSGDITQISWGEEDDLAGCYGPEGRIAFVRQTPIRQGKGGLRIFVREPGGGLPLALTPGPTDHRPAWSPDGSSLVYQSLDASGSLVVMMIDPAGGEPRLLTRGGGPVFTPDGEWIVYSAPTRAGRKLWKMRRDGSGKRALGRSPHEEIDPAVSPDGDFVAFVSVQDRHHRLMVRPIDGSGDRPLIIDGEGLAPIW